jgi:chromosome segregation ATPase
MSGTTDEATDVSPPDESGTREKYDFEVADLDVAVRDLLQIVEERGETHTSELRKGTGMGRGRLKYRMDKLEERGIVTQELKRPDEGGQEMRHLQLTEKGREALDAGLLADITDVNTNVANLRVRVSELERDVRKKADDHMAKHYAEVRDDEVLREVEPRIEDVEAGLADTEDTAETARSLAEERTATLADRLDGVEADTEERLAALEAVDADDRLDDLEERVEELEDSTSSDHQELAKVRRKVKANTRAREERDRELAALRERLDEEHEAREEALSEAQRVGEKAKDRGERARKKARDARHSVRGLESDVAELREAVEALEDEVDGGGLLPW